MNEQARELILLRYRSAIADKEWAIACANMETARGGWTCDWNAAMHEAQQAVDAAEVALKAL